MTKKRSNNKENTIFNNNKIRLLGIFLLVMNLTGLGTVIRPAGFLGKITRWANVYLFGRYYLLFIIFFMLLGLYMVYKNNFPNLLDKKLIGVYIFLLGLLIFSHRSYIVSKDISAMFNQTHMDAANFSTAIYVGEKIKIIGGGIVGGSLAIISSYLMSKIASTIFAIILIVFGVSFLSGVSLFEILKKGFNKTKEASEIIKDGMIKKEEEVKIKNTKEDKEVIPDGVIKKIEDLQKTLVMPPVNENTLVKNDDVIIENNDVFSGNYELPPITLLNEAKVKSSVDNNRIKKEAELLLNTLDQFGIKSKVVDVHEGPSVTQYELEIASGIKLSRLTSLNSEIALNMGKEARIEAPIPGKKTVGIELARDERQTVCLREIIEKEPQSKRNNKLMAALGYDIMGEAIFSEINKTPHLLIAGSTGSGKSVCTNALICSILMRAKPDEVKLVLVDPKKVELSNYNGVPHLLMPVVVDPRKASVALQKIVEMMEDRFDEFSDKKVKNIDSYNEWVIKENIKNKDNEIKKMPYIVVIIDELADLMMVAAKDVEASIQRITQMARAAGIHLVVATQRPSTDVITGIIKANIPSRIAFAVASNIDSRTILDQGGAEKLLGKGDMLYLPMGESKARRIQGAFLQDEEIEKIIKWTTDQQKAKYNESFLNLEAKAEAHGNAGGLIKDENEEYEDPYYEEAYQFVVKKGKASISLLQRQFRIGYNRAARLIDLLEERGVIGPETGSTKPRSVLIARSEVINELDEIGEKDANYED